jgi:hypothetical protein
MTVRERCRCGRHVLASKGYDPTVCQFFEVIEARRADRRTRSRAHVIVDGLWEVVFFGVLALAGLLLIVLAPLFWIVDAVIQWRRKDS